MKKNPVNLICCIMYSGKFMFNSDIRFVNKQHIKFGKTSLHLFLSVGFAFKGRDEPKV